MADESLDVIEATPEKKPPLATPRPQAPPTHPYTHSNEYLIEATPTPLAPPSSQAQAPPTHHGRPPTPPLPYTRSNESNAKFARNHHAPYAFYDIDDILRLRPVHFPLHVNMRTVGVYSGEHRPNFFLLADIRTDQRRQLLVDCRLFDALPTQHTSVELFGSVEMREVNGRWGVVFVGDFWSPISGDTVRYAHALKTLQMQFLVVDYCDIRGGGRVGGDSFADELNESGVNRELAELLNELILNDE